MKEEQEEEEEEEEEEDEEEGEAVGHVIPDIWSLIAVKKRNKNRKGK